MLPETWSDNCHAALVWPAPTAERALRGTTETSPSMQPKSGPMFIASYHECGPVG